MKYFVLYLIIGLLTTSSCSKNYITQINRDDLNWKNLATSALLKEYVQYKKMNHRPNDSCYQSILDLYYKVLDINKYPYNDGFTKMKNEIISNSIVFDSIICSSMQYGFGIDPEYLYPFDFSLFYNGKVISRYVHDPEKLTLEKEKDFNQKKYMILFEKMCSKTNGDDLSLIILTRIKPDWTFEISKVIINSNPIIYDND